MTHAKTNKRQSKPTQDRRTKLRLRELCDEVLASYHVARGRDLFSGDDRKAARELMASVVSTTR